MTKAQSTLASLTAKVKKLPLPPQRNVEPEPKGTMVEQDGDIPAFLRRERNTTPPKFSDKPAERKLLSPSEAMAMTKPIEAAVQQAEAKAEKSRVRIEKLKAKQSGAADAMPLTGKDALKAINAVETPATKLMEKTARVTLISPKPTNGNAKLIEDHINKNGVTKVETGKTAAQVPAQTKGVQKAEKKQPKKAAARSKKTSHASQSMIDALKGGATMDALCKLIGKHPHDVHCIFYRIRKLGHKIDFSDNNYVRTYRIGETDARETKKATKKWC